METKKPTIPPKITDSVVDETLKAHITKWERYIEQFKELPYEHGAVKQHWLDWAIGESSPQEEFRGEHPYPNWEKEHFERLYEGAKKWYEEYIAKKEEKRKKERQERIIRWRLH